MQSFAVYYGQGMPAALRDYHLAILAPEGRSRADILALQAGGTRACAYLSALELPAGAPALRRLGTSHCLRRRGQPWFRPEFDTWVMDPRSPTWVRQVAGRARELAAAGYGCILLDTIGDVEDPEISADERGSLLPAAAHLVRQVRLAAPDCALIQNWGLFHLLELTADWIDGVMWEGVPLPMDRWPSWARSLAQRLAHLRQARNRSVFLLAADERGLVDPAYDLQAVAPRLGFVGYTAPGSYVSGVAPRRPQPPAASAPAGA